MNCKIVFGLKALLTEVLGGGGARRGDRGGHRRRGAQQSAEVLPARLGHYFLAKRPPQTWPLCRAWGSEASVTRGGCGELMARPDRETMKQPSRCLYGTRGSAQEGPLTWEGMVEDREN